MPPCGHKGTWLLVLGLRKQLETRFREELLESIEECLKLKSFLFDLEAEKNFFEYFQCASHIHMLHLYISQKIYILGASMSSLNNTSPMPREVKQCAQGHTAVSHLESEWQNQSL